MIVLDVNKVAKTFGATTILSEVSFKVRQGEKAGLIGENGCGKSTLLKMIVGEEPVSKGTIAVPKGSRIGYLVQQPEFKAGRTVGEEIREVFRPILDMKRELREAEAAMGNPEVAGDEKQLQTAMTTYGRLLEAFEREGGYIFQARFEAVLDGLGIGPLRDQLVDRLSGGEKNIVALAKILLEEPDILLLDEPGNHLDFEGLAWLEAFLQSYKNSLLLVSHDRYLLDRVVGRVVEIEDGRATTFSGNYSAFRAEKLRLLIKQKKAYGEQQREVRRLEDMIKRYEVWGGEKNIRCARNKQKMLDRMDRIDRPNLDRTRIDPRFGVDERSGRITLELNAYSRGFGDRVLFDNADLLISFGECVGLLGANGSGKTTLFRDIVKEGAWENRTIRIGPRVKLGYYAQEHETLDLERTVLEEMQWGSELNKDQAFSALSKFLFGWGDMDRKVKTLSGGEKSRVQLAKLMVSGANFLLLDEPTNHLDIPSREQVEEALEGFEGTLLIISHDRYFLDKIVGRIVEVENPNLISYAGNFSDFWTQKKSEGMEPREKRPVGKRQAGRRTEGIEDLEQKIEVLEAEKLSLEGALSEAFRKRDYKRGERHSQQLRRLEAQIEDLYEAL